ncbi:PREDICTED: uncharacterized protein LOC106127524 [Papilio xuthus]|uniref:Mitochondrial assembly of ribosomal large subunit protein 1 n=1 Tax=Papilio xuthus TaxID=66420 RepID=A0AAJ6ZX77_PAPXU|nr:PREDICTED: uncharacterized protein LOC106127524 [Papilio xuthus]
MFKSVLISTVTNFCKYNTSLKCKYNVNRFTRFLHQTVVFESPRNVSKDKSFPSAISRKYEVLNETNLPVIEHTADEIHMDEKYPILSDEFDGINLERGKNGVFEIEDLVELLQRENSKNIFVASVPKEINYVEYICVVSGRSKRHIKALAEFVRKVYKKKCYKSDHIPRIEGKDSDEWMALDLGNIALHIFSDKAREVYDLETLWAVGPEYDEKMKQKSDVVDIFENYSSYLKDLKPLE